MSDLKHESILPGTATNGEEDQNTATLSGHHANHESPQRHLHVQVTESQRMRHPSLLFSPESATIPYPDYPTNMQFDIRAKTMYGLVEEVATEFGASGMAKKLLVLNNRQAASFNMDSIGKLIDAFELHENPRLVIKLLNSESGAAHYQWFTNTFASSFEAHEFDPQSSICSLSPETWHLWNDNFLPGKQGPSIDAIELDEAKVKLVKFFSDVVIPLCAETNAIVLLPASDWDVGAHAFCQAANLLRSKWGEKLPFSMLGFGWRWVFQRKSTEEGSVAFHLYNRSNSFRKNYDMMEEFNEKYSGPDRSKWVNPDLLAGIDNYILWEGAAFNSYGRFRHWDTLPAMSLENLIFRYFNKSIPSFAMRCTRTHPLMQNQVCVDVLNSSVPVLFLDLRDRQLVTGETRREKLMTAAKQVVQYRDKLLENFQNEVYDICNISFLHAVLKGHYDLQENKVVNISFDSSQYESLSAAIDRKNKFRDGDSLERDSWKEDLEFVVNTLKEEHIQSFWQVVQVCEKKGFKKKWETVEELRSEISDQSRIEYGEQVAKMLSSPKFFGRNVRDLEGLRTLIDKFLSVGKTPEENSLQGLKVLQEAWNTVDVCAHVANSYKLMSRCLYLFLLLVGLATTAVTLLKVKLDDCSVCMVCKHGNRARDIVFYVAMVAAVVWALASYYNPTQRWRVLRNVATRLTSQIWMYRARAGPFQVVIADPSAPDVQLRDRVMQLRAELIESAGMEQTSFMAKYPPRVFTHHQNQDCPPRKQSYKADEMQDNHHSPLPSHQYMELRVNTMIKFFRRRLPLYKFRVALFNWLIIVLIAAAAAVANIESAEYGAICMALATAVVSWMEFDGTRQKLSRYNKSLVSLNNIVTWWNSISDSHKASVESVSLLVMQVESVIAGESDAWLAVPMTKGIEENKQKLEASYDITTRRGSFL